MIAYLRSRPPSGSCVDAMVVGNWTKDVHYVAWRSLLGLAIAGVAAIGWAACQSIG